MKDVKPVFKYIYGPVASWRLGRSLGIDPISQEAKVCCFDCTYCQVGRCDTAGIKRKVFVKTKDIVGEIAALPAKAKIDYITFSGTGEPTMAANLGELIEEIKKIRPEPVAVITNSALLGSLPVRRQVEKADLIMAKLDAPADDVLRQVNNPAEGISVKKIIDGIKKLRGSFKGILALQIMFVKENKQAAEQIAALAKELGADKVYVNTPLRPCQCEPLSRAELAKIKNIFVSAGIKVKTVYDSKRKKVLAIDTAQTRRKRRLQVKKRRRVFKRR